ncbi:MAG: PEP-CTERM sorting domain-containing protein [Akkermansia muciniphila]
MTADSQSGYKLSVMKKLFVSSIMTAVLLPGWVNAESPDLVTLLSLTKPQNGVLSSGNSSLTWSEGTTGTSLDNFAISFQLTETRILLSPKYFLDLTYQRGASGNALQLTSSSADDEYTCLFSYAGQSFDMTATTERGSLLLTLIMRKSEDGRSASATLYSGTQTLGTVSFNFTSGTSSLKWDQSSIWTNTAKETFTNIKLATFNTEATDTDILNAFNLQVPEPATASLSLLGLAALMVRRRRKA